MQEPLIQYILNHSTTPLSQEGIETIENLFVPKKLKKKYYFLQEGEVCKYFAFNKKPAKKRPNKYAEKLAIKGTFADVFKVIKKNKEEKKKKCNLNIICI